MKWLEKKVEIQFEIIFLITQKMQHYSVILFMNILLILILDKMDEFLSHRYK